jgi:cell division protein FtsB
MALVRGGAARLVEEALILSEVSMQKLARALSDKQKKLEDLRRAQEGLRHEIETLKEEQWTTKSRSPRSSPRSTP